LAASNFGDEVPGPPPSDLVREQKHANQLVQPLIITELLLFQVTQWETIALKEYMFDGDQNGWESGE
jgi:hypothetical protein